VPVDVSLMNAQTGGVYAEIEAVGPGTTRPMTVNVGSGTYAFQCDSGSDSELTGPTTTVPGDTPGGTAVVPADVTQMLTAVTSERTYVERGLATVARQAAVLRDDIDQGNLTAAQAAWLTAHLSYERLGSAYGMFGDYDDEIDGTAAGFPDGISDPSFTGFYRIEYGLWHGQSAAQLTGPAYRLVQDIGALRTAYPGMISYPQAALSDLALRTHEILEHSIRFQLSGADDYGSGTTLATADANVEATRAQLSMLRPLLASRYQDLPTVYTWLGRLRRLVDAERTVHGWTAAAALSITQREDIDSAAAQCVQLLAPVAVMFEASPLP
jgi:iron uptake system component EfeO